MVVMDGFQKNRLGHDGSFYISIFESTPQKDCELKSHIGRYIL